MTRAVCRFELRLIVLIGISEPNSRVLTTLSESFDAVCVAPFAIYSMATAAYSVSPHCIIKYYHSFSLIAYVTWSKFPFSLFLSTSFPFVLDLFYSYAVSWYLKRVAMKSLRWCKERPERRCRVSPNEWLWLRRKFIVNGVIRAALSMFLQFRLIGPSRCTRRSFQIAGTCGASRLFSQMGTKQACTILTVRDMTRTMAIETFGGPCHVCSVSVMLIREICWICCYRVMRRSVVTCGNTLQ